MNADAATRPVGATAVAGTVASLAGTTIRQGRSGAGAQLSGVLSTRSLAITDEYNRYFDTPAAGRVARLADPHFARDALDYGDRARLVVEELEGLGQARLFWGNAHDKKRVERGAKSALNLNNDDRRAPTAGEARIGFGPVQATIGMGQQAGAALAASTGRLGERPSTFSVAAAANPFMDLGRNARNARLSFAVSPKLQLTSSVARGSLGTNGSDEALATSIGAVRSWEDGAIEVEAGALVERGTMLGTRLTGAFHVGGSATTAFGTLRFRQELAPGIALHGMGALGHTRMALSGPLATLAGTTMATAWTVGLDLDDVLVEGDRMGLSLHQPLRLENGRVRLALPTSYDRVTLAHDRVDAPLAPGGREVRLEAGYARPIDGGEVSAAVMMADDAGHQDRGMSAAAIARITFDLQPQ